MAKIEQEKRKGEKIHGDWLTLSLPAHKIPRNLATSLSLGTIVPSTATISVGGISTPPSISTPGQPLAPLVPWFGTIHNYMLESGTPAPAVRRTALPLYSSVWKDSVFSQRSCQLEMSWLQLPQRLLSHQLLQHLVERQHTGWLIEVTYTLRQPNGCRITTVLLRHTIGFDYGVNTGVNP